MEFVCTAVFTRKLLAQLTSVRQKKKKEGERETVSMHAHFTETLKLSKRL